ncbi:hypothetical protein M0813_28822 [Anaeramoeba flamelloides]|uniref:SH3 domain-containing protein n=1 Tax=Anaeramoeba flamelloides TaxID=1746091 RepID=A0ABQ8XRV3_9EUKA|nr:hypothetical protein M0813_28822 [Anaeramoeba flamelloides]
MLEENIPLIKPQKVMTGHIYGVNGVMTSDDKLYSASDDKTVKQWGFDGELLHNFEGHNGRITSMKIVKEVLYTGSHDHTIRTWSLKNRKQLNEFTGHEDRISTLFIDNERMFTGSADKTVRVWDIVSGNCQHVYKGHTDQITAIQFDNDTLYSGSVDKTITMWSTETRQPKEILIGHKSWVLSIFLDKKNEILWSASKDGSIMSWDIKTAKPVHTIKAHKYAIFRVIPYNGVVYTASWDGTIGCWDQTTGKLIRYLEGHVGKVSTYGLYENYLYSGGRDRTIRVWNLKNGKCEYILEGHRGAVHSIAFTEDWIFSGSSDSNIIQWPSIRSGKKRKNFGTFGSSVKKKARSRYQVKTNDPDLRFVYYCFFFYDDLKQKIGRLINNTLQYCKGVLSSSNQGLLFCESLNEYAQTFAPPNLNNLNSNVINKGIPNSNSSSKMFKSGSKGTLMNNVNTKNFFLTSNDQNLDRLLPNSYLLDEPSNIDIFENILMFNKPRKQIEVVRKQFASFIYKSFVPNLKSFQSNLLKPFKKYVFKFEKARKEHSTKVSQLATKIKKAKKNKKGEFEKELNLEKKKFEKKRERLANALEHLESVGISSLISDVCEYMLNQISYFKESSDILSQIEMNLGLLESKLSIFKIMKKNLMIDMQFLQVQNIQALKTRRRTTLEYQSKIEDPNEGNNKGNENNDEDEKQQQQQQQQQLQRSSNDYVVSILSYKAKNEKELSFQVDDVISVLEKNEEKSLGLLNGKIGHFFNDFTVTLEKELAIKNGYLAPNDFKDDSESDMSLTRASSSFIGFDESESDSEFRATICEDDFSKSIEDFKF